MKVVVAGMPKTGTKSVSAALRKLGYEVYDFMEHLYYLEKEWGEIFDQRWTSEQFRRMYNDVDAAVDLPASLFWEQIYEAFPDCKVILTVRDTDEKWVNSLLNHYDKMDRHITARILQFVEILIGRKSGPMLTQAYQQMLGIERALWRRKTHLNPSILMMKYRQHNTYVTQRVPKERLLVFNCKQGWEPLCNFLEKPIQDGPFPHENIQASVVEDTNRHPIADSYKSEVTSELLKLLAKVTVGCVALAIIVNLIL